MFDGVVDHAEAEKRPDRPLYSLTFGGQGDVSLDETQGPVAIGEKDFPQLRRQIVIDKRLRRADGTCAAVIQLKQPHGRGGAARAWVSTSSKDGAYETEAPTGFPDLAGCPAIRRQLEFHRGRDRDALAFAHLPINGV